MLSFAKARSAGLTVVIRRVRVRPSWRRDRGHSPRRHALIQAIVGHPPVGPPSVKLGRRKSHDKPDTLRGVSGFCLYEGRGGLGR